MSCELCQGNGCIEDEYGEWKLQAVKLTPLPPIILSGDNPYHRHPAAEPPYWALFLRYLDEGCGKGEHASFPIKYCPLCGRSLEAPKKPLTPDEWIKKQRELRKKPGYEDSVKQQQEAFAKISEFDKEFRLNEDGSVEVLGKLKEKQT